MGVAHAAQSSLNLKMRIHLAHLNYAVAGTLSLQQKWAHLSYQMTPHSMQVVCLAFSW